jgi:hypothetical protein
VQYVTGSPLTIAKHATATVTAVCPAGKNVIGGGFATSVPSGGNANPGLMQIFSSAAGGATSWSVSAYNDATGALILTAYAICAFVQ